MCRWSKVPPSADVWYRAGGGDPVADAKAPSSSLAERSEAKSSEWAFAFPFAAPDPFVSADVSPGHSHRSTDRSSASDGRQILVPRMSSTTTSTLASNRSSSRYARVAALYTSESARSSGTKSEVGGGRGGEAGEEEVLELDSSLCVVCQGVWVVAGVLTTTSKVVRARFAAVWTASRHVAQLGDAGSERKAASEGKDRTSVWSCWAILTASAGWNESRTASDAEGKGERRTSRSPSSKPIAPLKWLRSG